MKKISNDDRLLMIEALEILIEDMENDINVGRLDFLESLNDLYEKLAR